MILRHVMTIFCDDVRQEILGKLTFVGVYAGQLFVPTFPTTLAKLCLAIDVITPARQPLQKVVIRVLKDDDVLTEAEVPGANLIPDPAYPLPPNDDDSDNRLQRLQSLFAYAPFPIEKPCRIRVRVQTESEELRGLGLRIQQAPPGMFEPFVQDSKK